MTKIKASNVNNLTDARYFAARGVEWLGIPLGEGTERAVSPAVAKAFIEWVDGVKIVGEFDFAGAAEILELHGLLHFDAVQVGMFADPEALRMLNGLTIIKEVVPEKSTSLADLQDHLRTYAACCDIFLLNFGKNGIRWDDLKKGMPFSMDALRSLCEAYPVILSLDFTPHNLHGILQQINPLGLEMMGGDEETTGFKSFDELDLLLDLLEG